MYLYHYHYASDDYYASHRISHGDLGYSLITVLISLSLSTILMACSVQWYFIIKKEYLVQQNKIQNLESGLILLQILQQDFENSGYLGCRTKDRYFPIHRVFTEPSRINLIPVDRRAVYGFNAVPLACWREGLPEPLCARVKEQSDVLILFQVAQKTIPLKAAMTSTDAVLETEENSGIRPDSLVLLSDCLQGDLFIANDIRSELIFHQVGKNQTRHFSKAYGREAEITELQTISYYLAETNGRTVLYRENLRQEATEIIGNINSFEVEYGFYTRGRGVSYKKSAAIRQEEWPSVVSVKIKVTIDDGNEKSKGWDYEFSIRNRLGVNLGFIVYDGGRTPGEWFNTTKFDYS